MSSTYTTSLTLTQIGNGEQSGTWGTTTNTNWQLIEDSVAGVAQVTVSGSTGATLSVANGTTDQSRNAVIVVTGSLSTSVAIVAPLVKKVYIISNQTSGGFAITIGATTGSTVSIANGLTTLVYCDGTNFFAGITGFTGGNLSITGNITASGTITGSILSGYHSLPGSGPTGGGGAAGQIAYQTGANTTQWTSVPTTGQYLTWNGTACTWVAGSVTTATNLAGGSAWSVPYQTSTGNTSFLTPSGGTTLTLQWNGSSVSWAPGGAVTSFSAGTTGLTPNTPTGTAVVLGGTLNVANGGTQLTSSGTAGNLLVSSGGLWASQSPATAGLLTTSTGAQLTANNTFAGSGYQRFNAQLNGIAAVADASAGGTTIGYASIVNATTSYQMVFGYGAVSSYSAVGTITSTGSGTAYNTSSDRRLKENITPLTNSGAVIDAMQPRTFTWISTKETAAGFIADELQQVVPSAVHGQPNAVDETGNPIYQGIDASTPEMIALLVAEVQSLRKRVTALEAKVGA